MNFLHFRLLTKKRSSSRPGRCPALLHGTVRRTPDLFFFSLPHLSLLLFLCVDISFSLHTYISVSPFVCFQQTHTRRGKELNNVGPLSLHYVNHHFPSAAALFASRLHFIRRMQIPAKLSSHICASSRMCEWAVCLQQQMGLPNRLLSVCECECISVSHLNANLTVTGRRYI
ncbi:hypothetical protein CRENBAI_019073 [Crenichthys baileyi]|uniref:Transmembrane protein n=1 Tax=Crenichthys baileyi TaxID=28760 RepID=A0AAV9RB95_9TELE